MEELKPSTLEISELIRLVQEKKTELKSLQNQLKKRGGNISRPLSEDATRSFRIQFKEARAQAISDAEDFDGILYTLERLGQTLLPNIDRGKKNLAGYEGAIEEIAVKSPLSFTIPKKFRYLHTPFDILYNIVRDARNDALHQGAYARHLTNHAIELSLIVEDAMSKKLTLVSDFMVRNVIYAESWQPISHIRQIMLANNFSYIPFQEDKKWYFISDFLLANILIGESNNKRDEILSFTLRELIDQHKTKLTDTIAEIISPYEELGKLLNKFKKDPFLVCENEQVIGIITAFDVM